LGVLGYSFDMHLWLNHMYVYKMLSAYVSNSKLTSYTQSLTHIDSEVVCENIGFR